MINASPTQQMEWGIRQNDLTQIDVSKPRDIQSVNSSQSSDTQISVCGAQGFLCANLFFWKVRKSENFVLVHVRVSFVARFFSTNTFLIAQTFVKIHSM